MVNSIIVAIDGFSSCGKSTIAKALARYAGYTYVDTGAMYRTIALYMLRHNIVADADIIAALPAVQGGFTLVDGAQHATLNGEDVERFIRTLEVGNRASQISQIKEVRAFLVAQQQAMGESKGIVMDGRDIGTVVFPKAELKLFLTASPEVRAQRRFDELVAKGEKPDFQAVLADVNDRDYRDTHRAESPLKQAEDAIVVDNSHLTPDEQMEKVIALFNSKHETLNTKHSTMSITIDINSGFCFGVTRAIQAAESELRKGSLCCLGDIVHNGQEVARLELQGLQTIDYDDLRTLPSHSRVLLRAHGEPPATYWIAQQRSIEIIDATCPVVKKLQDRIRACYETHRNDESLPPQIIIYGQPGHAEVIGLQGQTNNTAIVIESVDQLDRIDFSRPIYLFSQTTKSVEGFQALVEAIKSQITIRRKQIGRNHQSPIALEAHDTICRSVANRVKELQNFARANDLVIFVGGTKSSNARVLYKNCVEVNPNTIFISSPDELTHSLIHSFTHSSADIKVGICGATSTPQWLMEQVSERLSAF